MAEDLKDWLSSKVEIRDSLIQGKGMFAKELIKNHFTPLINKRIEKDSK